MPGPSPTLSSMIIAHPRSTGPRRPMNTRSPATARPSQSIPLSLPGIGLGIGSRRLDETPKVGVISQKVQQVLPSTEAEDTRGAIRS